MRYFNWLLRISLFIVLLGFAVKNDQSVTLRFFFGYQWESSLVIVLFLFFSGGVIVGLLGMLASVFKLRREISRLKKDIGVSGRMTINEETKQLS